MPSDLTERLAAKLVANDFGVDVSRWAATWAEPILPLLLSEPELVASLPEATKAALLRTLLGERLKEIYDGAEVANTCIGVPAMNTDGERSGSVFPVRSIDLLNLLAPERAP